ncbi:hypothetical protein E0Z10_g6652 [Xylaria hypoxylon]|uniref:Uncharacterized protein n=1 Tax=Xylaria hypoxylon TaxID=37992 RepID=A0A4Z0YFL7_9PEZI|nr:hypothetical protein E0Z10_g6652 [Xylaria hypoxylon]
MAEPPRQRQKREMNYNKCRFCRKAKKANDLQLFYHKATEALVYTQEKLSNRWDYETKVRPKFAFVKDEETSFLNDFFDEMTLPNHPLAAFITLAFETGDTSFRHYHPYNHPLKEVAEAKVDHFRESGDICTALAMQEIVLLNMFESVSDAILASDLQKYCEISSEMAERLKMMLGREVPAVPPLHLLSLLTKGEIISKLTLAHSQFLATKDCFGRPLLHVALDLRVTADVLRSVGFDRTIPTTGDIWDRWPIHIACSGDSETVVEYVLDNTADHNIDHDIEDCLERSALRYASGSGNGITVRLLVEQGASVSREDQNGRTPVSWAAEYGHTTVLQLLLKSGADVSTKDRDGETALSKSAENGHIAVVKLLLENGVNINSPDYLRETALHKSVENGHIAVVKLLLESGADITSQDIYGETALLLGVRGRHTAIIKLLLENRADPNVNLPWGDSPLKAAVHNGYKETAELLRSWRAELDSSYDSSESSD